MGANQIVTAIYRQILDKINRNENRLKRNKKIRPG